MDRVGAPIAFWNPFSLEFYNPYHEEGYISSARRSLRPLDMASHAFGCCIFYVNLNPIWKTTPYWYVGVWLIISLAALLYLYGAAASKEWYILYRLPLILTVRWGVTFALIPMSWLIDLPKASFFEIFICIISMSPCSSNFFTSMLLKTDFRTHTWIAPVSMVALFFWIPQFCDRCGKSTEIMSVFDKVNNLLSDCKKRMPVKVGNAMDSVVSFLGSTGESSGQAYYPCWMITAFIGVTYATILPFFVIFVADVSSRSTYLQSRIEKEYHIPLLNYVNSAFRVGLLGFLTAIIALWFSLIMLRTMV